LPIGKDDVRLAIFHFNSSWKDKPDFKKIIFLCDRTTYNYTFNKMLYVKYRQIRVISSLLQSAPLNEDKEEFYSEIQSGIGNELDNIKNGDIDLNIEIQKVVVNSRSVAFSLKDLLVNNSGKNDIEGTYVDYKGIEYYLKTQLGIKNINRNELLFLIKEKGFENKKIHNKMFYKIL
jgi:hypothetical protein